jgi:hypothetical protein
MVANGENYNFLLSKVRVAGHSPAVPITVLSAHSNSQEQKELRQPHLWQLEMPKSS